MGQFTRCRRAKWDSLPDQGALNGILYKFKRAKWDILLGPGESKCDSLPGPGELNGIVYQVQES